ncbi:MAG: hypothetical protein LBP75_04095 [Planctomycetota bacterium]|jgi:hypothetical protein|nr:hypothetical protein [Planctomycetota bacterium]
MNAQILTPQEILAPLRVRGGYIEETLKTQISIYSAYFDRPDWKLNYRLLREAIEHYLCDISRLSAFRSIIPDRHKKAAYLMKWLVKIRPIYFPIQKSQPENGLPAYSRQQLESNDRFAIYCGLSELSSFPRLLALRPPQNGNDDNPVANTLRNLIYLFHHHPIDAEFLASELYLLDELLKVKT